MSVYNLPISLFEGVDYVGPTLVLYGADGSTPVDLTGYAAKAVFVTDYDDQRGQVAVSNAGSAPGKVALGTTGGEVALSLSSRQIAAFGDRAGRYDVFLTKAGVPTVHFLAGSWILRQTAIGR